MGHRALLTIPVRVEAAEVEAAPAVAPVVALAGVPAAALVEGPAVALEEVVDRVLAYHPPRPYLPSVLRQSTAVSRRLVAFLLLPLSSRPVQPPPRRVSPHSEVGYQTINHARRLKLENMAGTSGSPHSIPMASISKTLGLAVVISIISLGRTVF